VIRTKTLTENMHALEPGIRGYAELRRAVGQFADTTKFLKFTYLPFPFKDSATFYSRVQERFVEEHMIDSLSGTSADSVALRNAIKKYQKQHNLKPTGLINAATAYKLNDTDWERFKRIAITLDKYKLMPDSMPKTYVW